MKTCFISSTEKNMPSASRGAQLSGRPRGHVMGSGTEEGRGRKPVRQSGHHLPKGQGSRESQHGLGAEGTV